MVFVESKKVSYNIILNIILIYTVFYRKPPSYQQTSTRCADETDRTKTSPSVQPVTATGRLDDHWLTASNRLVAQANLSPRGGKTNNATWRLDVVCCEAHMCTVIQSRMTAKQRPVDRQFYSIDSSSANKSHFQTPATAEKDKLVDYLANNIIGKDKTFCGPFGLRRGKFTNPIKNMNIYFSLLYHNFCLHVVYSVNMKIIVTESIKHSPPPPSPSLSLKFVLSHSLSLTLSHSKKYIVINFAYEN